MFSVFYCSVYNVYIGVFCGGGVFLVSSTEGKCPKCRGNRVVSIYYGYLPFDLARKVEGGEIVYGGIIPPEEGKKNWACLDCLYKW